MEIWQLKQRQNLALEAKIQLTKKRIRDWYEYWNGEVYISFSGGKDSLALLNLIREEYPDVPAVFVDTGLEFPEIREFIKTIENVVWLKPKLGFKEVIEKYGYPIISKEQASYIYLARHSKSDKQVKKVIDGVMPDGRQTKFKISKKWLYLLNAPFEISDKCCYAIKKSPIKAYNKLTGKKAFIATMASESKLRQTRYLKLGCNAFNSKDPVSQPISFWLEDDVWQYIRENNLTYSKIYDMGYDRTGIFCAFGCHLEKGMTRFQRMQLTHPKLWDYCMKDWDKGGLGLSAVLEYINVPYEIDRN